MRSTGLALFALATLALPRILAAQGTEWSEATVGSDWELYARALAIRGLIPNEPWAIRPFSPSVLDQWSVSLAAAHPWQDRLPRQTSAPRHFQMLRSSAEVSDNSAFPWGMNDGPVWQGKGLNVWGTVGAEMRWGHFSARFEPLVEIAENGAFQLEGVPAGSANPYVDPQRPAGIDVPQRMGSGSYHVIAPGNSYVRFDVKSFGAGFSTEDLFWGPGIHNAILFDDNAAGFPHIFFGTNRAVATPVGSFGAQVIYGQLEQSDWAPPNPTGTSARLGAGFVVTWQPPRLPITVGLDRFFHREWPSHFTADDYTLPFGAFFTRDYAAGSANLDNQLASVFFSARAKSVGLEIFGEFGKNDRALGLRDLALEPELNSAWLLGFMKVFGLDSSSTDFWELRAEVADGRIPAITVTGRGEDIFYAHSRVTQGHTELGQLLGTPLIERSGGAEFALDHFTTAGKLGFSLIERQMPPNLNVGMPADSARSQWDFGFGGTVFNGANDITTQVGYVRDINRFPGQDVGNFYIRIGTRIALKP